VIVIGVPALAAHAKIEKGSRARSRRESSVSATNKMVSAIFIRRLLTVRAFNHRNHAVQKRLTGLAEMRTMIQSDNTRVPPVTEEKSPPDSRITGADSPYNGAFIDRSGAFDHFASSTGTISPASTSTQIAAPKSSALTLLVERSPKWDRRFFLARTVLPHVAQRRG